MSPDSRSKRTVRRKATRIPMPHQEADVRVTNNYEVALGYSEEQAVEEAQRCLLCSRPKCIEGCPVIIDIPRFISLIADRDFEGAHIVMKDANLLPATCGRVCPQETQCEGVCIHPQAIAIGNLERFIGDRFARVHSEDICEPSGFKVAIVGSGPSGLTCASELAKKGHSVTVFEALHDFGGVLIYGIPEFRLPKNIVRSDIAHIRDLGVKFVSDILIGRTLTIDDLMGEEGFNAVFIGSGAGYPTFLGIPGENLLGVYSAAELLTRVNLMRAYKFPEYDTPVKIGRRVVVFGAGNVAMDAARTALRLGAEQVSIVYRRTISEMPAREVERIHADEEGVIFRTLKQPLEIVGEFDRVVGIKYMHMRLGDMDSSGRRNPEPIPGMSGYLPCDQVIYAIGQKSNPIIRQTTDGIEFGHGNTIKVDFKQQTDREGVYAGGDVVTGAATVIDAMGAGKTAAFHIDEYLHTLKPSKEEKEE
ncbi:MAG: NADPH-dependent glutamate synthase [Candidatus Kariarchaeaceae archaeon]